MSGFVAQSVGSSPSGASVVTLTPPEAPQIGQIMLVAIACEDAYPAQQSTGGEGDWKAYPPVNGFQQLSVWGKKVTVADTATSTYDFAFNVAFPTTWAFVMWEADELPVLIASGVGLTQIGPQFDYPPPFPRPYLLAFMIGLSVFTASTDGLVQRASRNLQLNASNRLVVWDTDGPVEQGQRVGVDTSGVGAIFNCWFLLGYENAGDGTPAIEASSADDMGQPFNDFDARLTLSFMDRLGREPAVATDALGQVIARGTPVNPPALDSSRASYGLRSILGRMAQAPINRPVVVRLESPNNTAREALEATMTALKLEFAWLEWEPIPDLDLQTSVGTLTPRIDIVYHKPEARAAERKTVLGLLEELLEPFVLAGYEFAPSEANRFEVRPPARKQDTGQAIPLGWDKISREGITEIEPRFSPATVATLNYRPWGYQADVEVIEPSAIRIMPSYWQPGGSYGAGQQAPWLPGGFPGLGNWPPTLTDSQGSPIARKEVRLDVALLFVVGGLFSLRDSWLGDTNTAATLPLVEGVFLEPGSSVSLELTLKRWAYQRDIPPAGLAEPSALGDLTHTANLPTDGQEHLLWDAGGYWYSGPLDTDKPVVYKVFGRCDGAVQLRVEASLYQRPAFLRIPNNAWDFGTVLQIEATGTAYAQSDSEIDITFGDPALVSPEELARNYAAIPWLEQAQEEYGYEAVALTIERYSLAIDGRNEGEVLLALLESVLRERSRPRRRWQVPLGVLAEGVTPYQVNRLVTAPYTGDGYGLLTAVTSSKGTRGGRYQSEVTAVVEELPEEFEPLYFNGSSLLLSGSSALEV